MDYKFFVDSSFWHAWFHKDDQWHAAVIPVMRELVDQSAMLVTSDVILLEYMTLAKSRNVSAEIIERNIKAITKDASIDHFVDGDFDKIRELHLKYHNLTLSSFDLSILLLSQRAGISRLLTTDEEFAKCGRFVEIRPRADERQLSE